MKRLILALVVIIVATGSVDAGERGFYLGGGLGKSSFDADDFVDGYSDLRFEDDGFGYNLYVGYRVNLYFAVEGGYVDFGTIKEHEVSNTGEYQELKVGIDAWELAALGIVPLSAKTDLFVRVGAASWNADVRVTLGDETTDSPWDGTDLIYGLGLDSRITEIGVRVGVDYLDIPDTSGALMFSLGLSYSF